MERRYKAGSNEVNLESVSSINAVFEQINLAEQGVGRKNFYDPIISQY